MIDLHCHILAELDDGPSTLEEATEMSRIAVADGIRTVVATPHMFDGTFSITPQRRDSGLNALRAHLAAEGIPLRLLPGGECRINEHLLKTLSEDGPNYTLNGNGRTCLLEWHEGIVPPHFEQFLFDAQIAGIRMILAHPERHTDIQRKPQLLERLVERGLIIQISTGSLTGLHGRRARRTAEKLLSAGWVRVIATDAHSPDTRGPRLSDGVARAAQIVGPTAMDMVTTYPATLLRNGWTETGTTG